LAGAFLFTLQGNKPLTPFQMKRNAALRLAAINTAGITIWLRIQGAPLITDISSRGIVDLEMAGNIARWEALTGAWSRTATINNILIDFLYIPAYALLLSLACRVLAEKEKVTLMQAAGNWLAKAAWLAAMLDVIENLLMLGGLYGYSSPVALQLTKLVATIKFILVGLCIVYILLVSLSLIFKSKRIHGA
jgi:hypothetical protein